MVAACTASVRLAPDLALSIAALTVVKNLERSCLVRLNGEGEFEDDGDRDTTAGVSEMAPGVSASSTAAARDDGRGDDGAGAALACATARRTDFQRKPPAAIGAAASTMVPSAPTLEGNQYRDRGRIYDGRTDELRGGRVLP